MTRLAVFISGRGSNLQALIDARARGELAGEIGVVVSSRTGAPGLERAQEAGLRHRVVDAADYASREDFDAELDNVANQAGCGLICLAGFMRILTPGFADAWRNRLVNIHPALLPAFPGTACHRRVLESGVMITGCTVHFVRPALDAGPIIAQAAVPVLPGDDERSLADRVLVAEHRLYPMALNLVLQGRVRVIGERVVVDAPVRPGDMLVNPAP
ncbi:MAG: phosphoribosylglycinamide formyltransferase [bacterium]|nr:phosphoribosylglycinamide formyltransferase [bacterium]